MPQNIEMYKFVNIKNKKNYRRIENEINKLEFVELANIDKLTDMLHISAKDNYKMSIEDVNKAIKKYEKNGYIEKYEVKETYRKVLYLKGLDCGHCAMKIENLAKSNMNHEQILVDFATTRFIIETTDKELIDNIIPRVEVVAHKIDPRIVVMDASAGKKERVEEIYRTNLVSVVLLICGVVTFLIGLGLEYIVSSFLDVESNIRLAGIISKILYYISYLLVGHPVIIMFFKNILHKRLFDENFLMTLASIGAIFTGHPVEAVMVMMLYQIGEQLQQYAVHKSRKSISELLTLDAEVAKIKIGTEITEVDVETVLPGDTIVVQVGETIPLDGVVSAGKSVLDTKSITGEARPVSCKVGDEVISGSINNGSTLEIKVTKPYGDSMISKILDLVENASTKKAKAEHFITKFARVYTPIVVLFALLVGVAWPLIVYGFSLETLMLPELFEKYVYKAMVFLVVSCPCAIVISVPLAFFAGIGLSSKRGILVKGSNYLEALSKASNIVFDKTGTLTKGEFTIREICPVEGVEEKDLIKNLAYVEYYSTHPIGMSVVDYYGREKIFAEIIADFVRVEGKGVKAVVNGSVIYAGNRKMIKESFPQVPILDKNGQVLYVIKDKKYLGAVVVGDILRDEAAGSIKELRHQGIQTVSMLTGDHKTAGMYTANQLQIDDVYTDLLPDTKVEIFEEIMKKTKGSTIYVGDGINDAPVIATADVGIAMGGTGSDATIQIADVVIMSDNLEKINEAIEIARRTKLKVITNIIFALLTKVVVLIMSMFGEIPLWLAIFSDVGVSLLAIINSMSLTRIFRKKDKQAGKKHE